MTNVISYDTLALLKAATPLSGTVYMNSRSAAGDNGGGFFAWMGGNQSVHVTADPQNGIWVPPNSDTTGASGAWKRCFDGAANVDWWGATGDGSTNDTTAIAAAVSALGAINVTGWSLQFTPGKTYVGQIGLNGTVNASQGEHGPAVSGYGATLKGPAGANYVINFNGTSVAAPLDPASDPNPSHYVTGARIEGFTIDMTGMANSANTYAIMGQKLYNSSFEDIHVINEPSSGGAFYMGTNVYTLRVSQLDCDRVDIQGWNHSTYFTSTLNFKGLCAQQVKVTNAFSVNFDGGAIQGNVSKFIWTNCQFCSVINMDLEGNGGYVHEFTNCRGINSHDNNVSGYYTYDLFSTGDNFNGNLLDRYPLNPGGGAAQGLFAKVRGESLLTITGTAATTLYKFADSPGPRSPSGLFCVHGDDGNSGFFDLVWVAYGFAGVFTGVSGGSAVPVSAYHAGPTEGVYGAPPARTYSVSGSGQSTVLKVALSSVPGGSYNVHCFGIDALTQSL